MRIFSGLLIFLSCWSAYCDDRQIIVPIPGSPDISVLIMDAPVEDFAITEEGLVTWNTWADDEPSNNPPEYQHSSAEYEQTLNLVIRVFEKNYMPESSRSSDEPRVIYVIRVGEYFRSLVLNLEYHEEQPIPNELQALIEYINGLRQSNKRMQSDRQPATPSVGG